MSELQQSAHPVTGHDVVVVGIGAVSPYGAGVDALWEGVLSGMTAIRPVNLEGLPGEWIAGHVPGIHRRIGPSDPVLEFARTATDEAVGHVGGLPVDLTSGVVYGSCNGGLTTAEAFIGAGRGNVDDLRWLSPQAVAEAVAEGVSATGPVVSVNTACASGAHALMVAADLLANGECEIVVAGGADALSRTALVGFRRLGALASAPATPYAADRSGMSLGEGAASLVVCHRETARSRGWEILGVLSGFGMSADGYHITSPDPSGAGAGRAIAAALATSPVGSREVGYVNGHGTGTQKNDSAEALAVGVGLVGEPGRISLGSTKGWTGHLLGAAGALEAVITLLAIRHGVLPPSHGIEEVDPSIHCDVVTDVRQQTFGYAVSNSFAFGGANACLVLGSPAAPGASRQGSPEEVVLTSVGVQTPFDSSVAGVLARLHGGREPDWTRVEAEDDIPEMPRRVLRRVDRAGRLATTSAARALAGSGAEPGEFTGLFVGTAYGPTASLETFLRDVLADPDRGGSPAVFPNTVYNAPAGHATQLLGLRGPTATFTSDCAAGLVALGAAGHALGQTRARSIVVTALEVASPLAVGYRAATSTDPREAFHEVSVSVVAETATACRERGSTPLGRLVGTASGFGHDASGLRATLTGLLERAGSPGGVQPVTYWRSQGGPLEVLAESPGVEAVRDVLGTSGHHGSGTALLALGACLADGEAGLHLFAASTEAGAHTLALVEVPRSDQEKVS